MMTVGYSRCYLSDRQISAVLTLLHEDVSVKFENIAVTLN